MKLSSGVAVKTEIRGNPFDGPDDNPACDGRRDRAELFRRVLSMDKASRPDRAPTKATEAVVGQFLSRQDSDNF
ncbi:hypothetical protein F2Q68_00028135 [Brassica cretica]|uniref:Uncharacterized protein n=1 Tax=Brassica cretica TaxID=69181 RepID=A0A8S9IHS9_BRACR|nr:hypothetical protein F2Q68_00028135 [Brassica cretica]